MALPTTSKPMKNHYQEYLELQSKLITLIAHDEDESEQGEALREELDKIWRKLTTEQKLELNKDVDFPKIPHPLKKVWQTLFLALFLLFSFSSVHGYDLDRMPSYDVEKATEKYVEIEALLKEYAKIIQVYFKLAEAGIEPSKEQDKMILKCVDIYVYWKSVAIIHLYNGDYTSMQVAIKNANKGLTDFKTQLVKLVQQKGI